MKKDQEKGKRKKKTKDINWEERLFQVAIRFIDPATQSGGFDISPFLTDRCIHKAKSFIKEYKRAYNKGKFDDII